MKKLITLALSFMMIFTQANAATGSMDGLKNAIDDLNYSLNVEWDQKDQNFYAEQLKNFQTTITSLRAEGMTSSEISNFIINNLKDESLKNDIRQIQAIAKNQNVSEAEMNLLTQEVLKRSYNKGSAWLGAVLITGAVLIILILAVTSAMINDAQQNAPNCGYDWICGSNGQTTACAAGNYHCW
jgi:hypothetical protein